MLTKIILNYDELNPIGDRQWRYDETTISEYDIEIGRAKEYVRKALAFMFKVVNDRPVCDSMHFIDEFGTSLFCEAKPMDVIEKRKVVHVIRIDKHGNKDVPYVTDLSSLRKKLYSMCEVKEVAA